MAKYLIVSDIHQDDRALDVVLKNAKDYEAIWCLGDVVGHEDYVKRKYAGYKGNAQVCYDMLKHYNAQCIIGNWEGWLLCPEKNDHETAHQHKYAQELIEARANLDKSTLEWIATWQETLVLPPFTLVHGSIDNDGDGVNERWEKYIYPRDITLVKRNFLFRKLSTPHMLYGHTHIPGYFNCNSHNMPEWQPIKPADLINREFEYNIYNYALHFVINPGSLNSNFTDDGRALRDDIPATVLEIDTQNYIFRYLPVFIE